MLYQFPYAGKSWFVHRAISKQFLGSFLVQWPKVIVKVICFNKLLDKDAHGPSPIPSPVVIDSNSDSETEDALFCYHEIQDVGNKVTFAL
eukprot:10604398-Ditylum_brightwellii.AAC.1